MTISIPIALIWKLHIVPDIDVINKSNILTFHDANIGIYGYRVQNVDIDVMARFQMKYCMQVKDTEHLYATNCFLQTLG